MTNRLPYTACRRLLYKVMVMKVMMKRMLLTMMMVAVAAASAECPEPKSLNP